MPQFWKVDSQWFNTDRIAHVEDELHFGRNLLRVEFVNGGKRTAIDEQADTLRAWLDAHKVQPIAALLEGFPELTQEQAAEMAAALETLKASGAWELLKGEPIEIVPAPRPEDDSHERYILQLFSELQSAALLGESIYGWMRRADAALMRELLKK